MKSEDMNLNLCDNSSNGNQWINSSPIIVISFTKFAAHG